MTKDDILQMAHEAGFNWPEVHTTTTVERLERFAALVVAKAAAEENEACAKLAQMTVCDTHVPTSVKIYGARVADAIRARHNTKKDQQ